MAFDTETYPVQPLISEADASETRALEGNIRTENKTPSIWQKDKDDDFCKDTQISNWENEGGAHSDRANAILWNRSINSSSVLTTHMDAAEALLTSGDYDGAFTELQTAAELFMSYRDRIDRSFNNSIAQLSTLGCRATPHHPKALPLVKLHHQITP